MCCRCFSSVFSSQQSWKESITFSSFLPAIFLSSLPPLFRTSLRKQSTFGHNQDAKRENQENRPQATPTRPREPCSVPRVCEISVTQQGPRAQLVRAQVPLLRWAPCGHLPLRRRGDNAVVNIPEDTTSAQRGKGISMLLFGGGKN